MMLNLIELFESVQGETSFSGLPTTFIRLAACNLRCTWCDTAYSFGRGEPRSIQKILAATRAFGHRQVCVTGGEPLLQKAVYPLLVQLCNEDFKVSIETGGSLSIEMIDPRVKIILDIKCPGSSMEQKNHWSNLPRLRQYDEVKFVLADRDDYLYAKEICTRYDLFHRVQEVLFSPVFDQLDPQELIRWILDDKLRVRLNLQIHKFIWLPSTKGV